FGADRLRSFGRLRHRADRNGDKEHHPDFHYRGGRCWTRRQRQWRLPPIWRGREDRHSRRRKSPRPEITRITIANGNDALERRFYFSRSTRCGRERAKEFRFREHSFQRFAPPRYSPL